MPVVDRFEGPDVVNRKTRMDLLSYWKLSERPFEATWDTRFFFQSRAHEEALERLTFLVTEESMHMGMLTGEIGCGKTLVRGVLDERLDEHRFERVILENSSFPFIDLMGYILRMLGDDESFDQESKIARYERLCHLLDEFHEQRTHVVLIFDEAQEMADETLSDLKMLTNLNGGGANYLTVILLGQPELKKRIVKLPAINQRISIRYHLTGLSLEETAAYLRHRLVVAGHPGGDLFTDSALEHIHRASAGVPREINRIAKLSLELAWTKELRAVTATAVNAVVHDHERYLKLNAA